MAVTYEQGRPCPTEEICEHYSGPQFVEQESCYCPEMP